MGRKVRIESEDGILIIRTAPIFQPRRLINRLLLQRTPVRHPRREDLLKLLQHFSALQKKFRRDIKVEGPRSQALFSYATSPRSAPAAITAPEPLIPRRGS